MLLERNVQLKFLSQIIINKSLLFFLAGEEQWKKQSLFFLEPSINLIEQVFSDDFRGVLQL